MIVTGLNSCACFELQVINHAIKNNISEKWYMTAHWLTNE